MLKQTKNLKNKKFGKLTVSNFAGYIKKPNGRQAAIWECICECGKIKILPANTLQSSNTKSCGCLIKERNKRLKNKGIQNNILPEGVAAMNAYYQSYCYRAKKKNLTFGITKEYFSLLVNQKCHFCGCDPLRQFPTPKKNLSRPYNGFIYINGLDRLNSSLGYSKENCVTCCEICNKAKRDLSLDEFTDWINRLINHSLSRGIVTTSVPSQHLV